jgi:hypothetical protein
MGLLIVNCKKNIKILIAYLLIIASSFLTSNSTFNAFAEKSITKNNAINNSDIRTKKFKSNNTEFELSNDKLKPLAGNEMADKSKDRINIVFAFSDGFEDLITPTRTLIKLLDLNGSIDPERSSYSLGMFATEPFKSNKDKFNLWFYDEKIHPDNSFFLAEELAFKDNIFVINYGQLNFFDNLTGRAGANMAEIEFDIDKNVSSYKTGPFIGYDGLIDVEYNPQIITHELGHALFGLADEYVEAGETRPKLRYPNCASNLAQATEWWGDLKGQADPFFNEWKTGYMNKYFISIDGKYYFENFDPDQNKNILEEINPDNITPWPSDYTVDYINGGCFSSAEGTQTRPTVDSIMNKSTVQVFGLVNLTQVNKILNLFSGTNQIKTKPNYPARLKPKIKYEDLGPTECYIQEIKSKKNLYCKISLTKQLFLDTPVKLELFTKPEGCSASGASVNSTSKKEFNSLNSSDSECQKSWLLGKN